MKLTLVCSTFNDIENLGRMLDSVVGEVDKVVIVDGVYKGYPSKRQVTRGLLSFLRHRFDDFSEGIKLIVAPGFEEYEKRTKYLPTIGDADRYYLMLDSDEELQTRLVKSKLDGADAYTVKINGDDFLRIWRANPGMEYKHNHYSLFTLNFPFSNQFGCYYPYEAKQINIQVKHNSQDSEEKSIYREYLNKVECIQK